MLARVPPMRWSPDDGSGRNDCSRHHAGAGRARSGKSAFAEKLIGDSGLSRIYLATRPPMMTRCDRAFTRHRAQRGDGWITVEEPLALVDALTREATHGRAVLVDCLTLWLSNLMFAARDPRSKRGG